MKKRRQAKILEIIRNLDVETQEDLQTLLLENGFEVTQATISRDIKELRLVKELSDSGRYVYSTGKKNNSDSVSARASGIFVDSVIIDTHFNLWLSDRMQGVILFSYIC